jgi:hypothetical protein
LVNQVWQFPVVASELMIPLMTSLQTLQLHLSSTPLPLMARLSALTCSALPTSSDIDYWKLAIANIFNTLGTGVVGVSETLKAAIIETKIASAVIWYLGCEISLHIESKFMFLYFRLFWASWICRVRNNERATLNLNRLFTGFREQLLMGVQVLMALNACLSIKQIAKVWHQNFLNWEISFPDHRHLVHTTDPIAQHTDQPALLVLNKRCLNPARSFSVG